jgi:hypothetical protein
VGALESDRFHQTLLWNIFRTFELLPPPMRSTRAGRNT